MATPRPTVSDAAERLYVALGPLTRGDDRHGWVLLNLCAALAAPLADVEDFASDTDTHPGWGRMLDPRVAPARALPWLGQLVGAVVPAGSSESVARELVQANPTWQRGTPAALTAAVRAVLTGSRTVLLTERYTGSAYQVRVSTYAAETSDLAAVTAAVNAALPAGLVATVTVLTGWSVAQAEAAFAGQTVADFETAYAAHDVAYVEQIVP